MATKEDLLARLDAIGEALSTTGHGLALLGLGSVGTETDRIDQYSDLDFFAIVEAGFKAQFIADLSWLNRPAPLVYWFQNTADGYKALYADDIFCEFAVFEPQELTHIPFASGRIVWKVDGFDAALLTPRPSRRAPPAPDWLLGEALTNLYVGLGRFWRGEKLSATRFIQGYAVDRVVDLITATQQSAAAFPDQFGNERRFERRYPDAAEVLADMMQGYARNVESAQATLAWLTAHFDVHPAMAERIRKLFQP